MATHNSAMVLMTDQSNSEWQRSMPTNSNPNRCHQLIEQLKKQYAYPIEILQFAINSTQIQMTIMNTKQIVPCCICALANSIWIQNDAMAQKRAIGTSHDEGTTRMAKDKG